MPPRTAYGAVEGPGLGVKIAMEFDPLLTTKSDPGATDEKGVGDENGVVVELLVPPQAAIPQASATAANTTTKAPRSDGGEHLNIKRGYKTRDAESFGSKPPASQEPFHAGEGRRRNERMCGAMQVYAATGNPGKLVEIESIFAGALEIVVPDRYVAPDEGDTSYAENAAIKARTLAAELRRKGISAGVIADDSGLEIRALNGAPGIFSARYGGLDASWADRRRALLQTLAAMKATDRSARFVCAMHLVTPAGEEFASFGTVNGVIAGEERGDGGFSYDAIFLLPERGLTFAEISSEEKNRISHRAAAARSLLAQLAAAGGF